MITIQIIGEAQRADINIPNEPFLLKGKLIPTYDGTNWGYSYEFDKSEKETKMCFPDENYDYDTMCSDHIFVGAYEDSRCIGLAILRHDVFKYMYIYDLKVSGKFRRQHVGRALIEVAERIAVEQGYRGLYVHAQDNNLIACMFYLATGFQIGGFDNRVYAGTNQAEKADITFYKDAQR